MQFFIKIINVTKIACNFFIKSSQLYLLLKVCTTFVILSQVNLSERYEMMRSDKKSFEFYGFVGSLREGTTLIYYIRVIKML